MWLSDIKTLYKETKQNNYIYVLCSVSVDNQVIPRILIDVMLISKSQSKPKYTHNAP